MVKDSFYLHYIQIFILSLPLLYCFLLFFRISIFRTFQSLYTVQNSRTQNSYSLRERHIFEILRRSLVIPSAIIQQRVLFSEEGTSRNTRAHKVPTN